jgi:hypothetical protein
LPQPIGLAVLVIVVEKRQRNFEISPPKPQGEGDMWCLYMLNVDVLKLVKATRNFVMKKVLFSGNLILILKAHFPIK